MTKQECLQCIKAICERLKTEDENLSLSIREPDFCDEAYDVACVVVITHRELVKEVRMGKRVSYFYTVLKICNEAIQYMDKEWFEKKINEAAQRVRSQWK